MTVGYLQTDYWAEGYWHEAYWADYGLGVPPLDVANYKTESWTVSKGIQDALWVLATQIDKHEVPAFFETIQVTAPDHNNITHTPFVGIIPATDYTLAAAADKANLIGYDHGWYLTVQYVPSDDRTTEEDTNPSDTITALLGGTAWATTTSIEPYRINTVADWTNIKKAFEFGDRCTRWKAIQEICDYCNFVFVIKWRYVGGTWRPCAYFVHEDDIDTAGIGLDIPAEVTITNPDAYLMDGVSVKDSPEHQYNRVLATGYDAATATYFYATAQTAEVSAGTEIPIEYVYADASLNTQTKTDTKAQELVDFFQASAKVYVARFKRRTDLELYQKISFSGYNKIDTADMRITRISYSRSAANDVVEIEFSKDQVIQQLRRLARAVNPDYVAGTLGMVNSDLSDIGLIDVFDYPIASGTVEDDLWELYGSYVQLSDSRPVDMQEQEITKISHLRGSLGYDFSFWGSDSVGTAWNEFMRWDRSAEQLEIKNDLYINNDTTNPRIYFDTDSFRPIHIQGVRTSVMQGLEVTVGNDLLMRFINYEDSTPDLIGCYENMLLTKDLTIVGSIKGDGNSDLVFWDSATGQKTLSELATGGGADGLWEISGSYVWLSTAKPIDMREYGIDRLSHIKGSTTADVSFIGINSSGSAWVEFMNWDHSGNDLDFSVPSGGDIRHNVDGNTIMRVNYLGLAMYDKKIYDLDYIDFTNRDSVPSSSPGRLYFDRSTGTLKYSDNYGNWKTITAT